MIQGMNHITLAVTDIAISFAFYKDVLGFTPLCKWNNGAYFLVGDLWFCLNVDSKREANPCYTHYAFTVAQEDFARMSQHLIKAGCPLFKENSSPGESLYFLDPDGHKLEIHSGTWQSRIAHKKENLGSWQDVEWYID